MSYELESTNCSECTTFRLGERTTDAGNWYDHYCAASPLSEEERTQILTRMGTPPERRMLRLHGCGDVLEKFRSKGKPLRCGYYEAINQMKWKDVFIFWPQKIDGKWRFLTTVKGRKRRVIEDEPNGGHVFKEYWEYKAA